MFNFPVVLRGRHLFAVGDRSCPWFKNHSIKEHQALQVRELFKDINEIPNKVAALLRAKYSGDVCMAVGLCCARPTSKPVLFTYFTSISDDEPSVVSLSVGLDGVPLFCGFPCVWKAHLQRERHFSFFTGSSNPNLEGFLLARDTASITPYRRLIADRLWLESIVLKSEQT